MKFKAIAPSLTLTEKTLMLNNCNQVFPEHIQNVLHLSIHNWRLLFNLHNRASKFLKNIFPKLFICKSIHLSQEELVHSVDVLIKSSLKKEKLPIFIGIILHGYNFLPVHKQIENQKVLNTLIEFYKRFDIYKKSLYDFSKYALDYLKTLNNAKIPQELLCNIAHLIQKEPKKNQLLITLSLLLLKQNYIYQLENILAYITDLYEQDLLKVKLFLKQDSVENAKKLLNEYTEDWDFTISATLDISTYLYEKNNFTSAFELIQNNLLTIFHELTSEEILDIEDTPKVIDLDNLLVNLAVSFYNQNHIAESKNCTKEIININTKLKLINYLNLNKLFESEKNCKKRSFSEI